MDTLSLGHTSSQRGNADRILNSLNYRRLEAREAILSNSFLAAALIDGADFGRADLRYSFVGFARASGTEFGFATLDSASFINADLRRSNFRGASLRYTNFDGAELRGAGLSVMAFMQANFDNADLRDAFINYPDDTLTDILMSDLLSTPAHVENANITGIIASPEIIKWLLASGAIQNENND